MRLIKRFQAHNVTLLLLGAVLAAGCGDDDGGGTTTDTGAEDAGSDDTDTDETDTDTDETDTDTDETDTDDTDVIDAGSDAGTDDGGPITDPEEAGVDGEEAGAGDAGADAETDSDFEPVVQLAEQLLPNVNDLRGLVFTENGQIYASGHVGASTDVDREVAVMRFNADGTVDESFGTDGLVTHNLVEQVVEDEVVVNDGDEQSLGIVELASGELIVQANVRDDAGLGMNVVLVKLDADGELVSSFGSDGVLRVDLGWTPTDDENWPVEGAAPSDMAWDLKLDTSSGAEKLVLFALGSAKVGELSDPEDALTQRTDNDRYVVRLLATDGTIDPDFNGGEVFSLNSGGTFSDNSRRGYVAEDGTIVSAGYTNFGDGLGNHVMMIRLLPSGVLDSEFGFGIGIPGVVRTNPFIDDGGMAEAYAVGTQSTGRYVSTGYGRATGTGVSSRLGWATTDGVDLVSFGFTATALDASYGQAGTLAVQSEEYALGDTQDRGRDLVVLPDDRVVHVGRFGPAPAIFVTLPDGAMDLESGLDGRFEFTPLSETTSHFFKVALSADGTTIAATTSNHADGVLMTLLNVDE